MYLARALKVLLFCREAASDFLDAEISMLKCFRNICAFDLISCDLILAEVQHTKPQKFRQLCVFIYFCYFVLLLSGTSYS